MKAIQRSPVPVGKSKVRRYLLLGCLVALVCGSYLGWVEWTALDRYRDALKAIDSRKLDVAMEHLEACKRAWPENAEVAFLMARTARRGSDFVTAGDELERAERLGWPPEAIAFERALARSQQGNIRPTEYAFVEAVRKGGPDVLYIVEILGPAYARSHSPSLAMEMLEKWAELQPDAPAPHFWMAQVSKRLELRADAHLHYAKALELEPTFYAAAVRLAREYFEVRAYEDARQLLEPFLAREPKDRELRLLVAHACQKPEHQARARTLVESLCVEFPADGEVMLERGRVESRDERHAEAETWLRRAFEKIPFDPQVAFNLARALAAQGKDEESKKWHDRFVQIEKDQRRIEELTRRISRDARDIDSRIEMAVILRRNELPQPSLDWLGTALEIEPRSPRVHRELAATFEKLGRKDKAQQHAALADQFSKKP